MSNDILVSDEGLRVVRIGCANVHPPKISSRHPSAFMGCEFDQLVHSINSIGSNIQPILVRPMAHEVGHFEIVFGERRHRACIACGLDVRAIVDESLDDAGAFLKSFHENQGRKAISPFELGRQVLYGIERGVFKNQEQAAKLLGRNKGGISRGVKVALLPVEVISAFRSPDQIQNRYAKKLAAAVEVAPDLVKAEALRIQISGEVLAPETVLARLLNAAASNVEPFNECPKVRIDF